MALSCDPAILIADEPTTALDVTIQAQILELMEELQERTGTAIIMITHDLGVVADMADNILVMYAGRMVEFGTCDEVFYRPSHPVHVGPDGFDPSSRRRREGGSCAPSRASRLHSSTCRRDARSTRAALTPRPICRTKEPEIRIDRGRARGRVPLRGRPGLHACGDGVCRGGDCVDERAHQSRGPHQALPGAAGLHVPARAEVRLRGRGRLVLGELGRDARACRASRDAGSRPPVAASSD